MPQALPSHPGRLGAKATGRNFLFLFLLLKVKVVFPAAEPSIKAAILLTVPVLVTSGEARHRGAPLGMGESFWIMSFFLFLHAHICSIESLKYIFTNYLQVCLFSNLMAFRASQYRNIYFRLGIVCGGFSRISFFPFVWPWHLLTSPLQPPSLGSAVQHGQLSLRLVLSGTPRAGGNGQLPLWGSSGPACSLPWFHIHVHPLSCWELPGLCSLFKIGFLDPKWVLSFQKAQFLGGCPSWCQRRNWRA